MKEHELSIDFNVDEIAPINPDRIIFKYMGWKVYKFAPALFFYRKDGTNPISGMTPEGFVGTDKECILLAVEDIHRLSS